MPDAALCPRERLEGEIYLLPVSTWSHRVILTLRHTRAAVKVSEFQPIFTEFMIWARQGFPSGLRVTAPAMFRPGRGWVLDSHEIARVIDAARSPDVPTLFPSEQDIAVRRAVELGETLQSFWRGLVMTSLQKDPKMSLRLLFPKPLQKIPFATSFAEKAVKGNIEKYKDVTDACSEDVARAALEELTNIVKEAKEVGGVKYLFGGRLTYADFVVGQAIGLDRDDEPSVFKEVPITSPFDGEFPELRGYAKGILHRYVTAEDIRFPPPRFDVGRNVVE